MDRSITSVSHPDRDYWIDANEWSEAELSAFATRLSGDIERGLLGSRITARLACYFLFALSRTALPDVRGNYYWPSAFHEVSRRSNSRSNSMAAIKFEKFFREAIGIAYASDLTRLESHGIHHKYISIIFQQAGIGKDRNRILKGFLEFLVDQYSLGTGGDAHLIAVRALNDYVRGLPESGRSDVHFLSGVLVRLGSELLVLAEAIECDSLRAEAIGWSWNQLREFWITRAGVDLDNLTPSASQLLLDLVGRLSTLWLRCDIYRLGREGKIRVFLPGGCTFSECRSYRDLPIGPAEIVMRGQRQWVRIVDRKELCPEYLEGMDRDIWNWLDDEYAYKLSDSPFTVRISGAGSQQAVPYFRGDRSLRATRRGYFWGGTFPAGMPVAPGAHEAHRLPPTAALNVRYGFGWRHERLFIQLNGFSASIPDDSSTLAIGDMSIWEGLVRDGRPEGMARLWIDVERLSLVNGIEAEARLTGIRGTTIERTIIVWPLSDRSFLVVGRRVYRSGATLVLWEDGKGEFPEIQLLSGEPVVGLHADNLIAAELPPVSVLGQRFFRTPLQVLAPGKARIRLGDALWEIDCRSSVEITYADPERDVDLGGVSISGTGNVRVVRSPAEMRLRISDQRRLGGDSSGFWIRMPGSEVFCSINDEDWITCDSEVSLLLQTMPGRCGLDISSGPIEFIFGTPESRSSRNFHFFVCPTCIDVEPTRFGEQSCIMLGGGTERQRIRSSDVVTPVLAAEGKQVLGKLPGPYCDIWFRWKPRIFDWVLNGDVGIEKDYVYSLSAPSFVQADRQLFCELTSFDAGDPTRIEVPDGTLLCLETGRFNLWDLLSRSEGWAERDQVSISAVRGARKVTWTLDLHPVVEYFGCAMVQEISGQLELSANVTLYGYRHGELAVSCVSGGKVVQHRHFLLQASPQPAFSSACLGIAVPSADAIQDDLQVLLLWDDQELGRCSVPYSRAGGISNGTPLRELVETYKRTAAPALLFAILKQSISHVAEDSGAMKRIGNVMAQVSGNGDSDDEQWLHIGIRILESLSSGSAQSIQLPQQAQRSPDLVATVAALWILLAERNAARGALMPNQFAKAMNLMASLLKSKCVDSVWAMDFALDAYAFAVELPSRYGIHDVPVETDLVQNGRSPSTAAGSLASISKEYRNWLETI